MLSEQINRESNHEIQFTSVPSVCDTAENRNVGFLSMVPTDVNWIFLSINLLDI